MKRKRLPLNQFIESLTGVQEYLRQGRSTDAEYRRMLHTLHRAMEDELTDRQRQCVQLCLFEGLTARQAAQELCIHESTVSRHLKKARQRLGRVFLYSFGRLE